MSQKSAAPWVMKLAGEWFMDQAADLKELLTEHLADIRKRAPGADRAELDLTGVSDLDACCCQLLAVFLENLRRRGIQALPCAMTEQLRDKIALLGFSEALSSNRTTGG
jgi:anti-anti-sigma regulatory factor